MYAGGFYTYSIFALIFWETRRADFGVSMGHHLATAILIISSYILRYVYTHDVKNFKRMLVLFSSEHAQESIM